ncbi:hypothetical protein F5146DRAFT_1137101 [Armillaria mellea]|nr:hypothetical protein F5146DRAFT_1137101 [Armillaria mellea]
MGILWHTAAPIQGSEYPWSNPADGDHVLGILQPKIPHISTLDSIGFYASTTIYITPTWRKFFMLAGPVMNLKTPVGRKHKTYNGKCYQAANLKAGSSESSLAPPCGDYSFLGL